MAVNGGSHRCPRCGGNVYYVEKCYNYWTINEVFEDGFMDLSACIDSYPDEESGNIECESCLYQFSALEYLNETKAAKKENKNE